MVYEEQLERAVRFIESNLKEECDPETAAAEAAYSLHHFHRLFALVTGETPGSYIRKRRLTESAASRRRGRSREEAAGEVSNADGKIRGAE